MLDTAASVATAFGVLLAAIGIWLTRRSMVGEFEQALSARYRSLTDVMPIEFIRGSDVKRSLTMEEERAMRLYLELCEDELYFRRHGRVSSSTWIDWWLGIQTALRHAVVADLMNGGQRRYVELRIAAATPEDDLHDPSASRVRRAWARRHWLRRAGAKAGT